MEFVVISGVEFQFDVIGIFVCKSKYASFSSKYASHSQEHWGKGNSHR